MNTQSKTPVQDEIKAQEAELEQLMVRVMNAPLGPVFEKIEALDQRLKEIEKQCNETLVEQIFGLSSNLKDQSKATKTTLEKLPAQFGEVVEDLVSARLSSISDDVARLHDGQMRGGASLDQALSAFEEGFKGSSANLNLLRTHLKQEGDRLLDELHRGMAKSESLEAVLAQLKKDQAQAYQVTSQSQIERMAWEKAQGEASERCEQSIGQVHTRIGDLHLEAKAAVEGSGEVLRKLAEGFNSNGIVLEKQKIQLEQSGARFADELRRSGERIDGLAPQVSQKVERFGGAVQARLQQMQRRIVWLTAVSGLSLAGTVALLIKMLV